MSIRHGGSPLKAPAVFYFETEGMCIGENNIRRPGDHRERAEGERRARAAKQPDGKPCSGSERRPESLDRFSTAGGCPPPTLHGKGKTLFRTLFSPCKF